MEDGRGLPDLCTPRAQAVLSGDVPNHDDLVERAYAAARTRWLNINAFFALLWARDVTDEHFFAITTMRMCLEPLSRPGSSTRAPTPIGVSEVRDGVGEPQELQIEVSASWLRAAGRKIFACKEILGPKGNPEWAATRGCPGGSGGAWDGVDGFHPDRWRHWKRLFKEVSEGTWRENVIEAARASCRFTR